MSDVASKRITVEEYLAGEREASQKSEYLHGETFAMGGGTALHSLIAANLARTIGNALAEGPCRVFNSDMRVFTASGLYTYPDVSVVCHQPVFQDSFNRDVLVNPQVICEVLSPTTEAYDRGKKFEHYRSIVTLQEHILVTQDRHAIEHYMRQPDGEHWLLSGIIALDSQLYLPSLGIRIPMSQIYAKVDFA